MSQKRLKSHHAWNEPNSVPRGLPALRGEHFPELLEDMVKEIFAKFVVLWVEPPNQSGIDGHFLGHLKGGTCQSFNNVRLEIFLGEKKKSGETLTLNWAKSDFKTFPKPSKFDSSDDVDFSPIRQMSDSSRCSISTWLSDLRWRYRKSFSSVSFSTNEVTLLSIESDESEPESDELEFDLGRRGIV